MNLLVLGDSLSDGGWERDPAKMGSAWPSALARLANDASESLSVVNRSRGGWRSVEILADAREADMAGVDVLALFAGANDLWRRWKAWGGQAPIDAEDYGRNLTSLCKLARERFVATVWILTPCLLHADPDHVWNREMGEYREACARVAKAFQAVLIPTGEEFEASVRAFPEVRWTYDGVHPRPVGQERLAWTVYHHGMNGKKWSRGRIPPKPDNHRLGEWP